MKYYVIHTNKDYVMGPFDTLVAAEWMRDIEIDKLEWIIIRKC